MATIRYTQNWDYHYQHHVHITNRCKYIASGYISENADDITISGIYVDEQYRNRGYGNKVFSELMKWVQELGFNEVWLMCKKDNTNALKMYKKHGYTIEKDAGHGAYWWLVWRK